MSTQPVYPVMSITGVAFEKTSPQLRERMRLSRLEYVWVEGEGVSVSSEFWPGFPMSYKLRDGSAYQCEVFDLGLHQDGQKMPSEAVDQDGFTFYGLAKTLPDARSAADSRVALRNRVAVWTDGVSVGEFNKERNTLIPQHMYMVRIRRVDSPQAA